MSLSVCVWGAKEKSTTTLLLDEYQRHVQVAQPSGNDCRTRNSTVVGSTYSQEVQWWCRLSDDRDDDKHTYTHTYASILGRLV